MVDCRLKKNKGLASCKNNSKGKLRSWEKVSNIKPRFELTEVNGKFEVYHEPSGGLIKVSKKELLKSGFNENQLNEVEKEGTSYFKPTKC